MPGESSVKTSEKPLASEDENPCQKPTLAPQPWTSALQRHWKISVCPIANSVVVYKSNLRRLRRTQQLSKSESKTENKHKIRWARNSMMYQAGGNTDRLSKRHIIIWHLKTPQAKLCAQSNTSDLRHWHLSRGVWDNHPSLTTPVSSSRRLELERAMVKGMFYLMLYGGFLNISIY